MAGEHRAGTVVVRVTADTKGFRRQVEEAARGINDLDVNAVFEPDTAQLERAYREWNGKNASIQFNFKPNTKNIDPWMKRFEQQEERLRRGLSLKPDFDSSKLSRGLSEFNSRTNTALRGNGLLNSKLIEKNLDQTVKAFDAKGREIADTSFFKKSALQKTEQLSFATSLDKTVDKYREKKMDLYQQVRGLIKGNERLSNEQIRQFEKLSNRIVKTRNDIRGLKGDLAKATREVERLDAQRLEMKTQKLPTSDLWKQEREAAKQATAVNKALAGQEKELGRLRKAQSSLVDIASDGDAKRVSKMTRQVRALEESIVTAGNSLLNFSKARDTALGLHQKQETYADWFKGQQVASSRFAKEIEAQQAEMARESKKARDEWSRPVDSTAIAREQFAESRREAENLIDTYRGVRKELESDVSAMKRNNRNWFDLDEYKRTVKMLGEIDDRIEKLKKSPVTKATRLEGSDFQKRLADLYSMNGVRNRQDIRLRFVAENLREVKSKIEAFKRRGVDVPVTLKAELREMYRQLAYYQRLLKDNPKARVKVDVEGDFARLNRDIERFESQRVKVEFYEDGADEIRRTMRELEHKRLDVPVTLKAEYSSVEAEMRRYAEKLKSDPDAEIPAKLHIDKKHAEEELKRFQEKNDTLDMDVDLETALARAHLAYFTRPRTIDIFAKFHGTDIGKILNGMTYGASGLKGVENEFQNLVNLFDTLDKKVPRLALVGTVLSDIGAGAVNVAGTVGGLGKSIVSLSKAAYAAPAALTGLGAVFASFKMIYGDKGETWSSQIDFADTKLSQLSQNVQDAFYGKAKPAIMDTANAIGDSLVPEMGTLAKHEGEIVEKLMLAVKASYQANELPAVFDRVNESMDNLVPGAESLITALSHIGMVGGKYLPQFTQWLSEDASWFAKWAENVMDDSDRVDKAMSEVKEQAGYLGSSLRSLKGIAQGAFTPIAQYQNGIEQFSSVLQRADRAINSMSAQDTLRAWVTGARDAQKGVRDAFADIGHAANESRSDLAGTMTNLGQLTGNFVADTSKLASGTSGSIRTFSGDVRDGLSMVTSSLASTSPMFSSLVRMAGQLSKTFGGTLANSLKSAAPTIEAIANATSALSDVFSKLPAPIQGMLGLWMTFGRAGKSAWTALKSGALENIQSTMQYQNMLRQLGVTMDGTKVKASQLISAMARLSRNETTAEVTGGAMAYGNVAGLFTGSVKGMEQMGEQAEKTASKVANTGQEARLAAEGAVLLGNNASSAGKGLRSLDDNAEPVKGKLSGLKSVAKDTGTVLLDMLGGPTGIALTAGLAAAGTAFSAYSQHVEQVKANIESFNEAAKATPDALSTQVSSLEGLKNRLDNFGSTLKSNFSTSDSSWDKFWRGTSNVDSMSSALQMLGQNEDSVARKLSGSKSDYNSYIKTLQRMTTQTNKQASADKNSATVFDMSSMNRLQKSANMHQAAKTALADAQNYNDEIEKSIKTQSAAAGKSAGWVDRLRDEGQDWQSIADGLLSATEKKERLATVTGSLASQVESQRNANIQAAAASSSYAKTLQQVGEAMKTVNDLHSKGQQVWDAQKKDFDYTTEAGRTAADSLTALASSSNDYLNAMIKQGKSQKDVLAKQKELSSNFNAQASAAGLDAAAVDGLNSSLLMTPKEVTTQINVQSLEAKENLANVVDSMSYLFPDGTRKQVKDILLNSIWQGKTDANQLSDMVQRLSDGKHTVVITGDNKLAIVAANDVTNAVMKVPALKKVYLKAITEGKSDTEALEESISSIPTMKDAFVKAKSEGKSDLDALRDAIWQVPEIKEAYLKATSSGKSEVDALRIALSLIPDVKNTDITATDDTQAGVASAQSSVNGVKQASPTVIDATDRASIIAQLAKGNIEAVPRNWPTLFAGIGNTSAVAIDAKNQIVSVPTRWGSRLDASTTGYDAVAGLAGQWNSIQSKSVTLDASVVARGIANAGHKATGGRIHGPGTGTSDSIPMWLSTGEHVIKAASASKLDRTVGPNFLNVLNATGDLDRAVSQARTSYARSARDMSRSAYAAGGRVEKMMSGLYEVNVQIPDSSRELVSAVNDLRREVAGFRDGIGGEISRNSSPWPSKRDFVRDVLEASRGR
ncbi:hypothetical protein [Bifidobacterium pseudocatenulatum]|uniref:Uncharacterized protein n=1 Tax=Bifidobacterium pseudocatenulatum TaxID=28026 RepID=A0ABD4W4X8_BIFPS|nr:hypothetical protein [Bifidobacterium pseudocatenulatum]MDB6490605.1 hypothetical protein [Bifidobacterium pseudocatenulatum]MDB6494407.1 hypothetical protein [Bifidobacterium pseudocatenulatum]MDB6503286.1 hypothetical protein [Bifidobacterium pseudocatenulatum]